jgi:thiamine biosynthesis lipoprotein ApbE
MVERYSSPDTSHHSAESEANSLDSPHPQTEKTNMTADTSSRADQTGDMDDIPPEDLERALPAWANEVNRQQELLVTRSLIAVLNRSKSA